MRFRELELKAQNLRQQRAFYVDLLGLPLLEETPTQLTLQAGATRLRFSAGRGSEGIYHIAFNIAENKLAEAKPWLEARLQLLEHEGQNSFTAQASWNAEMVYFYDADGNIVEFIARHNLPTTSSDPFGPESITSVSEIGYVVPDVEATVARLTRDLGLEPYGSTSSDFVPLGDAEGLLIVVSEGRHWFPTTTPASVLPLELTLDRPQTSLYSEPDMPYRIISLDDSSSAG